MRFKVGDKVRVRTWEDLLDRYPSIWDKTEISIRLGFTTEMKRHCGEIVTIATVNTSGQYYTIAGDRGWHWGDEMFEEHAVEEFHRYTEMIALSKVPSDTVFSISDIKMRKIRAYEDGWLCLLEKPVFACSYGETQNYAKSDIHRRLTTETLPELEAKIGAENLREFTLDLSHFDNKNKYLSICTRIGIPTYKHYDAMHMGFAAQMLRNNGAMLATAYEANKVLHCESMGVSYCNSTRERAIMPIICLPGNIEVLYGG